MRSSVDRLLAISLISLAPLFAGADDQDPPVRGVSSGFSEAPLAERRERAAEALQSADPDSFPAAIEALADPDAEVRSTILRLIGGLKLEDPDRVLRRLEVLVELAETDPAAEVRKTSLESLGALHTEEAARALASLTRRLPPGERVDAARELAALAEGRELVAAAVRGAFAESALDRELPGDVLAELLPAYGRYLAETPGGGDRAAERAPFAIGRDHPSPVVRRAAERALEGFLGRLRELDRHQRADRMLARLAEDGLEARAVLFTRIVAALEEGGVDPRVALEGARQLGRRADGPDRWTDLRWRARALLVEGLAALALNRLDEAEGTLARAGDQLDGLIARRVDLHRGRAGAAEQADLLQERALVGFCQAFRRIAAGGSADDLSLLQGLRQVHRLQLEAQLVAARGDVGGASSLEPVLQAALSPFRLVFAVRAHPAWSPSRCISLRRKLGRSLASVCARELPGFDPYPSLPLELSDPVQDPRRAELLRAITSAELEALQRRKEELKARQRVSVENDPAVMTEIAMITLTIRQRSKDRREKSLAERYFDLRVPSTMALRLAEVLRSEGQNIECRILAERLLASLEEQELGQRYPWAVRLAAQTRLTIGGAWTDENQARQAEEEMLAALELLEGLQNHYEDRGAPEAAEALEFEIADALVSLAVNANVKMGDPERALEFFERAYGLRQGDFMRVMLACYRARSGKEEEARELVRGIPPSPRSYYNLACTYALLGDAERALELLERDFRENRISAGALEKQKAWAREDPDLESLREDSRFRYLTEAKEAEGEDE